MDPIERALDSSRAQSKAAGQAAQAVGACVAAMFDASMSFAKSSTERNANFATTMMAAKSVDSMADVHGAFVRDSVRAIGAMATKIADACASTAKQCNELAARAMETAAQDK